MYPYSSLCYILDIFCSPVLVPWGATSKVLSGTILTYHAEHWVSYVGRKQPSPTYHVQHFNTRSPRPLLYGGKLVVSRCEDILGGKLSVHEVH
jgi:hypothetical protein